jgi:iron complex transport system ATP-binding protein
VTHDPPSRLSLVDLEHDFGAGPVLLGVSCEVGPGDFLAIIGPNGAGKSTLVRLAAGLLRPRGGRVLLDGRPIEALPRREVARRLALVPQETSLAFPFRALEIVLMGRHPHLGPWQIESAADRDLARRALERVGLAGLEGRRFHEMSGGERQRLVLARAIAQQAPILLLDEPTAFLDLRHQVAIYDILADLSEAGSAVVVVTHDVNLAGAYCRRALALRDGRVRAVGPPAEVFHPDLLEEVYGVPLRAIESPDGGPPYLAPRAGRGRRLAVAPPGAGGAGSRGADPGRAGGEAAGQ